MRYIKDFSNFKKEAAFRAGKHIFVIEKMLKILNKRTGKDLVLVSIPDNFQNKFGRFTGFWCLDTKTPVGIRINFELGKSDKIVTVDYYKNSYKKKVSTMTVILNGLNIIQVINIIEDLIKGVYKPDKTMVENFFLERKSIQGVSIDKWVSMDSDAMNKLKNKRYSNIYSKYQNFVKSNGLDAFSYPRFKPIVMDFLKKKNINNIYLGGGIADVVVGAPNKSVKTSMETTGDSQLGDVWGLENKHLIQWDLLYDDIKRFKDNDPILNGIIIHGSSGVGKSYSVLKELKDDPRFMLFRGTISGFTGLLYLLYNNRENKIIVLDDNDAILNNQTAVNILKSAMDSNNPRRIQYVKLGGEERETTLDSGEDHEDQLRDFIFESKIMFISNLRKFPGAIARRCSIYDMFYTPEEVFDLIGTLIDKIDCGTATVEDKQVVYDYMREFVKYSQKIDFDQFRRCVGRYMSLAARKKDWKKAVRFEMSSAITDE